MATMAIGYRHNPKPRGNSAPSPFTNWAKGTLVNNNDGFVKQTKKYIFKGCTDSATYIKWGDKNLSWNMDSNGKSGHMYVPDEKYNSSDSSHNVLWAVKWAPYSMSAAGISFDFVQSTSSTGWGFGRMFLFYKHSSSGSIIARKLSQSVDAKLAITKTSGSTIKILLPMVGFQICRITLMELEHT